MLKHLGFSLAAVLVFVQEHSQEHFKCRLVHKVQRSQTGSDLAGFDVVSPLKLATGLSQDEVESAGEAAFLHEQQNAIVYVSSEELLEG